MKIIDSFELYEKNYLNNPDRPLSRFERFVIWYTLNDLKTALKNGDTETTLKYPRPNIIKQLESKGYKIWDRYNTTDGTKYVVVAVLRPDKIND